MERKTFALPGFALFFVTTLSVAKGNETANFLNSTTFRTCKTNPLTIEIARLPGRIHAHFANTAEIITSLPEYDQNNLNEILQSTQFPPHTLRYSGFVRTAIQSYSHHLNLIIRPDDIWAAIMTQFSFYINKHAEKFRNKFVNFEEQRHLEIEMVGTLRTVSWSGFVNAMTSEMDKNLVDPEVKTWVLPNFSTTTNNDKVVVGAVFMASMKNYFTYGGRILCGIPHVTLEGTEEDWKDILGRLEKLKEYDLERWYKLLYPIVTKFVEAKQGKVDKKFWRAMVSKKSVGCGRGRRIISGWVTAFAVFDAYAKQAGLVQKGRGETPLQLWLRSNETLTASNGDSWIYRKKQWPILDLADISSGIVEVDVKINEHGVMYNSVMLAGHMAAEVKNQNQKGLALKPALGWAIALKQ